MLNITLPDGSRRQFEAPVSVYDVAASIGTGLAKAALAGKVDGKLVDTSFVIEHDADLAIVTGKDAEGIDIIRHSTAHLMAYAVKELFPEAQVTIGPTIEEGFYYDFAYKRPFTPEDLTAIEAKMAELVLFTDMPGGSVNNTAVQMMVKYPHAHVISGANLIMLMEFCMSEHPDTAQRLQDAVAAASGAMQYMNLLPEIIAARQATQQQTQDDIDDFFAGEENL